MLPTSFRSRTLSTISKGRGFYNEHGNWVAMTVTKDDNGITVSAVGLSSQVEHTWTPMEAKELARLIDVVLA